MGSIITENHARKIVETRIERLRRVDEENAERFGLDLDAAKQDEPLLREKLYELVKAQYNIKE